MHSSRTSGRPLKPNSNAEIRNSSKHYQHDFSTNFSLNLGNIFWYVSNKDVRWNFVDCQAAKIKTIFKPTTAVASLSVRIMELLGYIPFYLVNFGNVRQRSETILSQGLDGLISLNLRIFLRHQKFWAGSKTRCQYLIFFFHLLDHITTEYTHPFLEQKRGILISKSFPTYRGMTSFGTLLIRVLSLRMVSRHWKARGCRTCVSCTLYHDHTWLSTCSSCPIEPSFRQL